MARHGDVGAAICRDLIMTTREQNTLLTQTGPNTAMGNAFRRYWIPALLSEEIPAPDCAPVRVKLLSERLVAFRDSQGKIGLLDEFCAHRLVSLWFGRNEDSGLRCPYHGWKYDTNGQCVDIPSEPESSTLCTKVKLTSYPCVERGGVVWTYMGAAEQQPPLPEFEWMLVPQSQRHVGKRLGECNYLQAMEGGIDSSHVSSLHSGELLPGGMLGPKGGRKDDRGADYLAERRTKFEVLESGGGLLIGACRRADGEKNYWRLTQWIMPWYTMIPPHDDDPLHGHAWVPIDDENCFAWNFTHHPTRSLTANEVEAMRRGDGIYAELIPGTYRTVANKDNDYLMDREAQKSGRYYSGVKGVAMQDASLQESMGLVVDRTRERLAASDIAIVRARRRLISALEDIEKGSEPPGLDPATHHVRSASIFLPADLQLSQAAQTIAAATRAVVGAAHTSV